MEVSAFLADQEACSRWLETQRSDLLSRGEYMEWWPHGKEAGFGLSANGNFRSMELHLMSGGRVTLHLEEFDRESREFLTLVSEDRQVTSLAEFEHIYIGVRDRMLASG